jgi:predicted nucleic acid-binding Zn ribbon protein
VSGEPGDDPGAAPPGGRAAGGPTRDGPTSDSPAAGATPGAEGAAVAELPAGTSGIDLARAALAAARNQAQQYRAANPGRNAGRRDALTRRSGSGPDDRDPQLLGPAIARLIAERGWETPAAVAGVIGRWEEIVGDQVAAHCVPEQFSDGEVVVRTDSTAWATQMRLLAPAVLRRLNEQVGDGTVRRITVLPPSAPTWRRGRLRAPGSRGPGDTYG